MLIDDLKYTKLVMGIYRIKRANGQLTYLVGKPTISKIRRECLKAYETRYNKKDEKALTTFFDPADPAKPFIQVIRKFDADKIKPLDNYLKGETEKTDDKNLELLAWLIDFRHRPYRLGMDVNLNDEEECILTSPTNVSTENSNEVDQEEVDDPIVEIERITSNNTEEEIIREEDGEVLPQSLDEEKVVINNVVISGSSPKTSVRTWLTIKLRKAAAAVLIVAGIVGGLFLFDQKDKGDLERILNPNFQHTGLAKTTNDPISNGSVQSNPRCQAKTQKRAQCKRNADSTGYCWQHVYKYSILKILSVIF